MGILDEDGPRRELTSQKVPDGDAPPTRVRWKTDSRAAQGWGRVSLRGGRGRGRSLSPAGA